MTLYDLHSHILPGMDDGADDTDESIEMLQSAYSQGVRICAATPHCIIRSSERIENFLEERYTCFEVLKHAISRTDIPLPEIILGAEVYMDHDISKYPNIKKLCYENTSYMLIELTDGIDVPTYSEWIYSISLLGIKPVIAHVHRYHNAHELISDLCGLDAIYQINCSNFLTIKGRRETQGLLETGNIFIASSDMHNTTSRACNIGPAFQRSQKKFPYLTEELFSLNPKKILGIS